MSDHEEKTKAHGVESASTAGLAGCQDGKCGHASDCAVHNEPAYPAGECDCNRCEHCGAGDDNHHAFTCPTMLHPDRRHDG